MQLPRAARAARGLRRSPWNAKFVVPGLWGKAWDAPREIGTTDFWHVRYLFVWQQTSWHPDMIGTEIRTCDKYPTVLSSINLRPFSALTFSIPSMDDLGWSMAEVSLLAALSPPDLWRRSANGKICVSLRVSASARTSIWRRQIYYQMIPRYAKKCKMQ